MSLKDYYENKALGYGISKIRERRLLELINGDVKGKSILDIGCAQGEFARKLEKSGARVTGVDISVQAIREAKKVISRALVFDFNNERLPFNNEVFDLIIASEIIEHLLEPQKVLKEINRLLKKDGSLILSTPNFLYWGNRLQFLLGKFQYVEIGMFDKGHIHFYSYMALVEDLQNTGFKVTEENHVFAGENFLKYFRKKFPGLFAYQFVVKCRKQLS